MITRTPCPGMYLRHKKKNPGLFVDYCKGFIHSIDPIMKVVGVETVDENTVYILSIPDMDAKKPEVTFTTVKGKKTKKIEYVPAWKGPIERFLTDDDIEFLRKRGMDRYGNKF